MFISDRADPIVTSLQKARERRQSRQMFIEKRMKDKPFDPGQGRTFSPDSFFYKHANPPGLESINITNPVTD